MPVSGLVITLTGDLEQSRSAVAAINSHPNFSVAKRMARWLPVAMEANDDAESRQLHDWLMALRGVEFVDVVSVDFEDMPHPTRDETGNGQDPLS